MMGTHPFGKDNKNRFQNQRISKQKTLRSAKARRTFQLHGPVEYACIYPLAVGFKWCYTAARPTGTSLNTEHWLQNVQISLQDVIYVVGRLLVSTFQVIQTSSKIS